MRCAPIDKVAAVELMLYDARRCQGRCR